MNRFVTKKQDETNDASSTIEEQPQASGPYHTVLVEERAWTANWINQCVFIFKLYIFIEIFY